MSLIPQDFDLNYMMNIERELVFANSPGDLGSIPGRVIPKTLKMVLDASLLNTQHYEVRIKGKVEKSREWSSAPLHLGVVAIEKGAFGSPSTKGRQLYFYFILNPTRAAIIFSVFTRVSKV